QEAARKLERSGEAFTARRIVRIVYRAVRIVGQQLARAEGREITADDEVAVLRVHGLEVFLRRGVDSGCRGIVEYVRNSKAMEHLNRVARRNVEARVFLFEVQPVFEA